MAELKVSGVYSKCNFFIFLVEGQENSTIADASNLILSQTRCLRNGVVYRIDAEGR